VVWAAGGAAALLLPLVLRYLHGWCLAGPVNRRRAAVDAFMLGLVVHVYLVHPHLLAEAGWVLLGLGRIVVSEIETPNVLADMV
jgi:hypothetical protein